MLRIAFATAPIPVTLAGIGCLLALGIKAVVLDKLPGFLPSAMELGHVMEAVLASVVAAYFFFVLSSQLPYVREQRHLAGITSQLASGAANRVTGFLQMIAGTHNQGLLDPESVDLNKVKQLFALVAPNGQAPMADNPLGATLNWIDAMARHDEQCHAYINRIMRYARFVDSELLLLLNALEDSQHAAGMRDQRGYLKGISITNTTLESWANNYYEAYEAARSLTRCLHGYRTKFGIAQT